MALGGSTNAVLHLLAIAHAAGVPLTLDDFEDDPRPGAGPLRPQAIGPVRRDRPPPRGRRAPGHEDAAGPRAAARRRAHDHRRDRGGDAARRARASHEPIRRSSAPGSGRCTRRATSRSSAATWRPRERSPRSPAWRRPGSRARHGSSSRRKPASRRFSRAGSNAGDVMVIRYEGPRGGPGMREMLAPTSAIIGAGLGDSVGLDHRWPILGRDLRAWWWGTWRRRRR